MIRKKASTYSSKDVCEKMDVTKNTLFKWEKEGKIKNVRKDWRGWRVYSDENVEQVRRVILEKQKKNR
ncbi:MerR family transcriptional regulator [candidate division KSB1 bacterium]